MESSRLTRSGVLKLDLVDGYVRIWLTSHDVWLTLPSTVETELKVTEVALDVHMKCTPFVKD